MEIMQQIGALWERQWRVVRGTLKDMLINYVIIFPGLFALSSGYFMPLSFFPDQAAEKGTEFLIGMIILQAFVVAYFVLIELLNERDESKVLSYHIGATSYTATFVSRLLFYIMYTYAVLLPFFPMAKLFLGAHFLTGQVNWCALFGILFLVASAAVSYIFCILCLISSIKQLEYLWAWGIEPVMLLSGMWAPAYAIAQSGVPGVSFFVWMNPFTYATEAVRQLFLHDARFQPISFCCVVLVGATLLFSLVSYFLLKRQLRAV